MCWYCCISLRGASYFGTSIHIFVGLVLLVRWLVHSYIAIFVDEKLMTDTSSLLLTILLGVYIIFFIIFGCLIFAATERQSVSLLKWSSSGFIILQFVLFTVIPVLYLFAPEAWTFIEPSVLAISMYFCCLVATLNYILVLLLYLRKLLNAKERRANGGSRAVSSLTNIRISHPIPHQAATVTSSTTNTTNSTSTYGVGPGHQHHYPYHQHQHQHQVQLATRRTQGQGPESPGIYESLDAQSVAVASHPFFPANFYSGYSPNRHHGQDGIYSGSASIRSGSGSGIYYHQNQRPYPYPHQRYREPLLSSGNSTTATIVDCRSEEVETPGQDWRDAYGHRLQVFQRGQAERNSTTVEPLLTERERQQAQTNY